MTSAFQFKQFRLEQNKAAMKVGTDGVLLGAWADHAKPTRILDIGAGTGLIGLMLAQRFPKAKVDLVELDSAAAEEAQENVRNSPFVDRCEVFQGNIAAYSGEKDYDLIVSNPPFFGASYRSQNSQRDKARHQDHLSNQVLTASVDRMLGQMGSFCLITPTEGFPQLELAANTVGLWCNDRCDVLSRAEDAPHRVLTRWSRNMQRPALSSIRIYENDVYSEEYRQLTRHFYLKH